MHIIDIYKNMPVILCFLIKKWPICVFSNSKDMSANFSQICRIAFWYFYMLPNFTLI